MTFAARPVHEAAGACAAPGLARSSGATALASPAELACESRREALTLDRQARRRRVIELKNPDLAAAVSTSLGAHGEGGGERSRPAASTPLRALRAAAVSCL